MVVPNLSSSQSVGRSNLGEILVEVGVISKEQLNQAISAGGGSEKDLPKWLIELGFTSEEKIMKGIGIKAKVPYFTSLEGLFTAESANIISEELARRLQVVPLFKIDNVATVAMVNPMDVFVIDSLVKTTGYQIDPVVCMRSTIFDTINKLYGGYESGPLPISEPSMPSLPPPTVSGDSSLVIEYSPSSPSMRPASLPSAPPPRSMPPSAGARKGPEGGDFSKIMEDLRTRMPEQKMSQMDIIQRDIQKSSEDMPIV